LRAVLLEGEPAIHVWQQWQAAHDLNSLDIGSFFLLPQLYLKLNRLGVDGSAVAQLRGIYLYTHLKNQRVMRSVAEVLRLFETVGIPALVLKGVPLVLCHYRDLGARMMNDMDLLIRDCDLRTAAVVLQEAGWHLDKSLPSTGLVPFIHATSFSHPCWSALDLHWHPFTVDCPPEAEHLGHQPVAAQDEQLPTGEQQFLPERRAALLKILAGGGAIAGAKLLPSAWTKPIINTIIVPAHAQMTGATSPPPPTTTATTTVTTPPPTETEPPVTETEPPVTETEPPVTETEPPVTETQGPEIEP
ncbi:MAG: nucleotidyltransferase family protein, partial [Deltaproteobacteria bacterium]|nr:nucleotidyltransferase family protein [Deltaproteobacteria bacterium]